MSLGRQWISEPALAGLSAAASIVSAMPQPVSRSLRNLADRYARPVRDAMLYARPIAVRSPAECDFYHTLDLPGFGTVWGEWDLRGRFDDYLGGVPLQGRRVLDVGTASGFLTFEAEKRGASVVSLDMDHIRRQDLLPFAGSESFVDRRRYNRRWNWKYRRIQLSYWLAHRLYDSHARVFYGSVYDLPKALGLFDVVILGAVLEHLANPIGALASLSRHASDTLVITNFIRGERFSFAQFIGKASKPEDNYSWWIYSLPLYEEVLGMLGFGIIDVQPAEYLWLRDGPHAAPVPQLLHTLIARRWHGLRPGAPARPDEQRAFA